MRQETVGDPAPRDIVLAEARNRIRDHFSRTARFNPTKSLTAITGQLTQEYEDRFLVELIQNAYDAQPPGSSEGRIHVILDEGDAQAPVLYIANTGRPFETKNFDALTNVAQSSKPPGEGIGNKGVGFRSVLQVCEFPEIYSVISEASSTFDGFCFGFASDAHIKDVVTSDEEYEIIASEFSRHLLPVAVEAVDPLLAQLRADGMVTVVRLPLRSQRALESARSQLENIHADASVPLTLFLDRVAAVEIEHLSVEEKSTSTITRRTTPIHNSDLGQLAWLDVGDRRFLVATTTLPAAGIRDVITRGVELDELDKSWSQWDSDAEVSIAISLDDEEQWPKSFTYLPMRTTSPVFAHLHAPFHTKMARLDLNERSLFNSYLLSIAARLAVDTAMQLRDGLPGVPLGERQRAVVDLLTWNEDHVDLLEEALATAGRELETAALVPSHHSNQPTWETLGVVRHWDAIGMREVTHAALAEMVPLLPTDLGDARLHRFTSTADVTYGCSLRPSDEEVADWIERLLAVGMQRASVATWNAFYDDTAALFATRDKRALQGRRFLLDSEKRVRRAGPWDDEADTREPTLFFPPTSRRDEDSDEDTELQRVPKNLQRAVAFLHDGIRLRVRERSSLNRTPVFELLASADLVERFELAAVLGHLERVLKGRPSPTTYRQALAWVFAQEQASRADVTDLDRVGLHVPTAKGWIPAGNAVFSAAWLTPRSGDLSKLLDAAARDSKELSALKDRSVSPPDEWTFKVRDLDAFRGFLARAGVRDGLHPVPLVSKGQVRFNGQDFAPRAVASRSS